MRIPGLALLLFPLVVFGQMDDNTLTVNSSRAVVLQPDQVVFSVYANFEATATLADVLGAVQSVGITEANFLSVSNGLSGAPIPIPTTHWSFVLPVPFSKQGDTLSGLLALQQSIGKNPNRYLGYSVQGSQVSPQSQASGTCPYLALFQDALAQARTVASAAGVMLGGVVAVSDGSAVYAYASSVGALSNTSTATYVSGSFVSGDFTAVAYRSVNSFLYGLSFATRPTLGACTMNVQFKLLH